MTQTAKLTTSVGGTNLQVGISVAVSGDTVVGGTPADNLARGSAYLFVKPGGGWIDMTRRPNSPRRTALV